MQVQWSGAKRLILGWKKLSLKSPSNDEVAKLKNAATISENDNFDESSKFTQNEGRGNFQIIDKTMSAVESLPFSPKLNTMELVSLLFFLTTAGPFGIESAVMAAGPKITLSILTIVFIFWSIPLALMTSELTCMMPETGGHVLWVHRAFGPFWACMNNTCTIAYGILDHAIYPTFFVECLSIIFYGFDGNMPNALRIVIKLIIILMITVPNFYGIRVVGLIAIVLEILIFIPLVVALFFALPHFNFEWIKVDSPQRIDWGMLFTIVLWKTSGFDAVSACGREVEDVERTYPIALFISTLSTALLSFTPILIGSCLLPSYSQWTDESFLFVAKLMGGPFLKVLISLSGAFSALGLLLSRLSTNARFLSGMASINQLPSLFKSSLPEKRTPWMAMLCTCTYTILLFWIHFQNLIQAGMLFYTLSTCLKFASLVQLRFSEPEAYRPFRIPLNDHLLSCIMIIPVGFCILLLFLSSPNTHLIGFIGIIMGILSYMANELLQQGYSTFFPFIWNKFKEYFHSLLNLWLQMKSNWVSKRFRARIVVEKEEDELESNQTITLMPLSNSNSSAPF